MITTITLNPAIDKTIYVDQLHVGEVNRTPNTREDLGGKSINVARLLDGYKIPAIAIFLAGKENYDQVKVLCSRETFNMIPIMVEGNTRTNSKIVETKRMRTTDINEPGFSVDDTVFLKLRNEILKYAKISDYVVISGSLPKGLPTDTYQKLVQEIKPFTKVVLDADGEILLSGIKAGPYLIKPNIHELEACMKTKYTDMNEMIREVKELLYKYKISVAIISLGEEGSICVTDKETFYSDSIPVQVKSTVGAGDAMLAGILYGLSNKMSHKEALALGTASSALAISQEGHKQSKADQLVETSKLVSIQTY